jgi:phosphoglycerol transferase MdoB-like AlkP superfamily enzyme
MLRRFFSSTRTEPSTPPRSDDPHVEGECADAAGVMSRGQRFVVGWIVFCVLQTLLVRVGTNAGYGPVAAMDEVGFSALLLGLFGLGHLWLHRRASIAILWLSASFLIIMAGSNQVYYDGFHSWAALYCLGQVGELGAVKSSIASMLPYDVIVLWFLIPFLLLFWLSRTWRHWQPRNSGWLVLAGLAAMGVGELQRVNVTSTTENHFILRAFRMEFIRLRERSADYDPAGLLAGRELNSIVAPMPGYVRGDDPEQPLLQRPAVASAPSKRPNIIIIEAESFRSAETGAYGAKDSITPHFDALAKEGLLAQNFYATGMQTVRGELSILCSAYPALGDLPLYKRAPKTEITCLPELLQVAGYETHWFSAYSATYSGKRAFLGSHGVEHIHGIDEHGKPDDVAIGWGVSDIVMADRMLERLDQASTPFMATWITLSNHHPWRWDYPMDFPPELQVGPESEPYAYYRRGIHYTDHALGYVVSKIRSRGWGKDAWIVITGDHGMAMYPHASPRSEFGKRETHFRVPFLLLAPGVVEAQVVERPASQVDIAPTLLDLMGYRAPQAFVGQSILRPADAPASPVLIVGVDSASIVVDDKRCMAAQTSCHEDSLPRCQPDQQPTAATHVCYTQERDLLFTEDIGLTPLSADDDARLRERLRLITSLQTHLESHDRLGGGDTWKPALLELMTATSARDSNGVRRAATVQNVTPPKGAATPVK